MFFDNEAYHLAKNCLVEHGNRYDSANRVDHDALRRYRSLRSRSDDATCDEAGFTPPPGSRLVAEVMNPIKERYQFIDLLKPESAPLLALILALEPGVRSKIGELARFLLGRVRHRSQANAMPGYAGDAAAAGAPSTFVDTTFEPELLHDLLVAPDYQGDMASLVDTLGGIGSVLELLIQHRRVDILERAPQIRRALRALRNDDTFVRTIEHGPYRDAAEHLTRKTARTRQFDCLIFGHTHVARQLTLDTGAVYINTVASPMPIFRRGHDEAGDRRRDCSRGGDRRRRGCLAPRHRLSDLQ
jgi:UDP-2,3-diacylglucosamine pyrophosphatase LpxH